MDEYRAHCDLIGKHVTIQRPTGTLEAQVIDINDHGAFSLRERKSFEFWRSYQS